MHRRAPEAAGGRAEERAEVRGSQDVWADVLLPRDISSCLQSIPKQRQQNNVVWFPVRDKLCTPLLRNAFCAGGSVKSVGQRGESGPSVGLTGGISHGGPLHWIGPDNGNEELMEMPI